MKVYLAGPMRGLPELNFPAFHKAAGQLRDCGYDVFSPAENDVPDDMRGALALDLGYICREADAVVVLPDWRFSRGATAEVFTARALGIPVLTLNVALNGGRETP